MSAVDDRYEDEKHDIEVTEVDGRWVYDFSRVTDLETAVFQTVGAASACWENLAGAGIFESDRAKALSEGLVGWLQGVQSPLDACWICGHPQDHWGTPHAEATGDGLTREAITERVAVAMHDQWMRSELFGLEMWKDIAKRALGTVHTHESYEETPG